MCLDPQGLCIDLVGLQAVLNISKYHKFWGPTGPSLLRASTTLNYSFKGSMMFCV